MKFQRLAIIGIIAVVTTSCTKETASNPTDIQAQPITTVASSPAALSGTFKRGEHPTTGTVNVITEQGKRYLEFDQNFKTDKGPDLFVILHRTDAPPISGIKEKDYVNIGPLKNINGSQRYALPDNVKLKDFRSVAIWCRKFNATFGYASLKV